MDRSSGAEPGSAEVVEMKKLPRRQGGEQTLPRINADARGSRTIAKSAETELKPTALKHGGTEEAEVLPDYFRMPAEPVPVATPSFHFPITKASSRQFY